MTLFTPYIKGQIYATDHYCPKISVPETFPKNIRDNFLATLTIAEYNGNLFGPTFTIPVTCAIGIREFFYSEIPYLIGDFLLTTRITMAVFLFFVNCSCLTCKTIANNTREVETRVFCARWFKVFTGTRMGKMALC